MSAKRKPVVSENLRRLLPTRTWPLRLLQVSPIIVALLGIAVWNVVPARVRARALYVKAYESLGSGANGLWGFTPEVEVLRAFWTYDLDRKSKDKRRSSASVEPDPTLYLSGVASRSWTALTKTPARLYASDGSLKPMLLASDKQALTPLREYERKEGARIFVWAVPARNPAPVAARAISDPSLLTQAERTEIETSGTVELLRTKLWVNNQPPYPLNITQTGGGSGGPDGPEGSRLLMTSSEFFDGHFWETYSVYPPDSSGAPPSLAQWAVDPSAPEGQENVRSLAFDYGGNVFVVGPLEATPVLQRAPTGVSEADARRLGEMIWPELITPYSGLSTSAFPLTKEQQAAAGGGRYAMLVGYDQWTTGAAISYKTSPPAMIYLAVSDENPLAKQFAASNTSAYRHVQVWVALNFQALLASVAVLLLVALVASPAAFVADRRRAAERDVLEEMERVRAEARERVLGKLTDLSRRMESVSEAASAVVDSELVAVSTDIDTTVRDLRTILGANGKDGGGRDA